MSALPLRPTANERTSARVRAAQHKKNAQSRLTRLSPIPLLNILTSLIYAGLLQWSYLTVEGVVGFTATDVKDVGFWYVTASFTLIALMAVAMPIAIQRPSQIALWVLYLTFYVPSMLFTYHVGQLGEAETLQFLLQLTLAFALLIGLCRANPIRLPRIKIKHATFVMVLVVSTLIVTGMVVVLIPQTHQGSLSSMFVLDDVYIRRLQSRQVIAGRSLTGYAFATLTSTLAPLCMIYGLTTGRRLLTAIGAIGLMSVFMLDGTKGYLFAPVLFVVMLELVKRPRLPFGIVCALGLSALLCLSMYTYRSSESLWLSSNIVRRVIVARATTLGAYFEMFRGAPVYMRDSSLIWLVGERMTDKSDVIGQAYANDPEAHWNGNAWAAMFGDFGVPGLFIASALIALILLCFDGTSRSAPFSIVAVMAGYLAHTWGDAAVTSSILTYGVLATLLVLNHYGSVSEPAQDHPLLARRQRSRMDSRSLARTASQS